MKQESRAALRSSAFPKRFFLAASVILAFALISSRVANKLYDSGPQTSPADQWKPPDTTEFSLRHDGSQLRYGRDLVARTAKYFGPRGAIAKTTNGLNCQNCHLQAGTKVFGNNYAAAAAKYPMFMPRSGKLVSLQERINGCFERSLNGTRLGSTSRELLAIEAYIQWVGKAAKIDKRQLESAGPGLKTIPFLPRAADVSKGRKVFESLCASCHGKEGEGLLSDNGAEWQYPPLYGPDSYNTGAGLYRLSKFAYYVKYNMPFGVDYRSPILTDEQAWDVAAFVNSMPHPTKNFSKDWPDLKTKPFDYPFGPYADGQSEQRHKYGPFQGLK